MTDEEIIREVAKIESAAEKRHHDRRVQQQRIIRKIGRVLMLCMGACLVIGCIGLFCNAYEAQQIETARRNAEKAQERAEKHRLQELAWQRCLDQLGLETCEAIEARLVEHCIYISDEQEMRACFQRKL